MAVILVVMFVVMKFIFPFSIDQPEAQFTLHKASVSIENPSLTFSKDGDREFFAVVGTIKNSSDVEWRSPYVEARFFNSKNEMIDTMPSNLKEVILMPKASTAFRITGYTARPSSEYARVEVSVTSARQKARWE
jgi:hypothetical protein